MRRGVSLPLFERDVDDARILRDRSRSPMRPTVTVRQPARQATPVAPGVGALVQTRPGATAHEAERGPATLVQRGVHDAAGRSGRSRRPPRRCPRPSRGSSDHVATAVGRTCRARAPRSAPTGDRGPRRRRRRSWSGRRRRARCARLSRSPTLVHVAPPSVDLYTPSPHDELCRLVASPRADPDDARIALVDRRSRRSSAPISFSKSGVQVTPLSVVFQTPPVALAA